MRCCEPYLIGTGRSLEGGERAKLRLRPTEICLLALFCVHHELFTHHIPPAPFPRRIAPTRITRANVGAQFTESAAETPAVVTLLTVQLVDGDCFHRFLNLLAGVAAYLKKGERCIGLACSVNYRIAGQTVAEFIRVAVPARLPQCALEGRVRISRLGWAPKPVENLADFSMFDAVAHALRCGSDPWNGGHRLDSDMR